MGVLTRRHWLCSHMSPAKNTVCNFSKRAASHLLRYQCELLSSGTTHRKSTSEMKIKLLVTSRDQRRAEAHCATVLRVAGDAIAATSSSFDEVARTSSRRRPDVVLLEHVPDDEQRVWDLLDCLNLAAADSRTLMLCDLCTDRLLTSFIAHGACGSVATASEPSVWVKAVMAVHQGESWFARSAVLQALRRELATHHGERSRAADQDRLLTAREREILSLIGGGMSNKEIGRALNISDLTVKTHLHHIYVKLNRSGRVKALAGPLAGVSSEAWRSTASLPRATSPHCRS